MPGQEGLHESGPEAVPFPTDRVYILIPKTHLPGGSAAESYDSNSQLGSTHSMLICALLEID